VTSSVSYVGGPTFEFWHLRLVILKLFVVLLVPPPPHENVGTVPQIREWSFCFASFLKVKMSQCWTKHHAMKTYWRSGGIAPRILDLGTIWRWVVRFTPRPLYPQGKTTPRYRLVRRLSGTPEPFWMWWWREKFPAPTGTRTPDHPARSPVITSFSKSCKVFFPQSKRPRFITIRNNGNIFIYTVWKVNRTGFPRMHLQHDSGAHPASYPMDTRGSFPGGKVAEAWSWTLTSIQCRG
jgi:hypothetical protein